MSRAEAKSMIVEAIGDEWLAEVRELDMGRDGLAYIAQLNRSVCLGSPIVVVEKRGKLRHAGVVEAKAIVSKADKLGVLNPALYC